MPKQTKWAGHLWALGAFFLWGWFPIYWKFLKSVGTFEILSHRIFWSAIALLGIVIYQRRVRDLRRLLSEPRRVLQLLLLTCLIGSNWGLYVWAVNGGHVLETSLGYFINPLFSILLGVLVLRERLRFLQWVAVGLVTLSVLNLVVVQGSPPWIALGLASSFAAYGLLKKIFAVESMLGLAAETMLLAPLCLMHLLYLANRGAGSFGHVSWTIDFLLLGAGVATALPLYCFARAAQLLPLSTLGFFQYLAPSLQFLCAVFLYREPFGYTEAVSFSLIWAACALLLIESTYRIQRKSKAKTIQLGGA